MSGASVNFQLKSSKKIPLIPGTRTCVGRSRTLISSGIISLDCILGGGYPLRDVILVEEDDSGFYAQLFIKYFISEGVVCGHNGFLASLDSDTNKIASELPAPVLAKIPPSDNQNPATGNNATSHIDKSGDLKIAWRYHDVPVVQSSSSSVFGHQFDLAEQMPSDIINNAELFHWQPDNDVCTNYQDDLLKVLEERLSKGGHRLLDENKPLRRTVLRIAIHSAGSPLWGSPFHLPQFFYRLRSLVDSSLSVCLITVPSRIIQAAVSSLSGEDCNVNIIGRCQHLSDWALKLESLADNDDPAYAEYSGLIYLNKLSTKNRLAPHLPDTTDWAFKLRKRRFIIEKLHLPPELGETVQREQDDTASVGCFSTNTANKLDF